MIRRFSAMFLTFVVAFISVPAAYAYADGTTSNDTIEAGINPIDSNEENSGTDISENETSVDDEIEIAVEDRQDTSFTEIDNRAVSDIDDTKMASPPSVIAEGRFGYEATNSVNGNLKWILYDDGKAIISGKGSSVSSEPFLKWNGHDFGDYKSKVIELVIEEGVTDIGGLYDMDNLKSVSIPSSVTRINDYCFFGDESITNIYIPSDVKTIGNRAFESCINLEEITLPSGLEFIGSGAFCYCRSLKNITIPATVKELGRDGKLHSSGGDAFCDCRTLSSVTFLSSSIIIYGPFQYCGNLTDIYYPGSKNDWEIACQHFTSWVDWYGKKTIVHYGILDGSEEDEKVTDVSLNKSSASISIGNTLELIATITPSNAANKDVTWTSSNKKIATVDKEGKVKGIKKGTAAITVTTADGKKTASCKVTVTEVVKVKSVKLNKKGVSLKKGKTFKLKATINPEDATNKDVTWKSSNKKIVKVGKNGKIKALKKGTATITVTTKDGKKKTTCKVTVR